MWRDRPRGPKGGTLCAAATVCRPRAAAPPLPPTPAWLPASLTAALHRHATAAAAAGKGFLRRALRGRGGGHTVGRGLLAPVQVAATRDVWGSGHPVAQVRRGAEGPCGESAAKALLIPTTAAITQAIESLWAPRMHRRRGRTRRAHPEPTTTRPTATSVHTASPPPPALVKLTTGSHLVNPEVYRARNLAFSGGLESHGC